MKDWARVGDCAFGRTTLNADLTVTYVPFADTQGMDRVHYTTSDANGVETTSWIDVEVVPVNDAPLTGGAGADVFVLHTGSGHDTVTDFDISEDRIDLRAAGLSRSDVGISLEDGGLRLDCFGDSVFLEGIVSVDAAESWLMI